TPPAAPRTSRPTRTGAGSPSRASAAPSPGVARRCGRASSTTAPTCSKATSKPRTTCATGRGELMTLPGCGSYQLGHEVQVIQWKLWSSAPGERTRCRAQVDDVGLITIVLDDGRRLTRRTHDPDRLAALSKGSRGRAEVGTHSI